MDLLRNRQSFSRHSVKSVNDSEFGDDRYNDTGVELDVYATVPLFEDAPSPSFPVTCDDTDLAKVLGIRGEVCTAVFSPQCFAVVRKSSVIFQAPYSSIKSYGLRPDAMNIVFGRVENHSEGCSLLLLTKYNKAMKECMHVNTEHVKRK